MSINTFLAFALLSLLIEITPGPNMAYLVILSLTRGWTAGAAAVAGVALGLACYGAAAAFGLAALIDQSRAAYEVLRWSGVVYLLWLAWDAWRDTNDGNALNAPNAHAKRDGFLRGLITNLLNPKAAVFYVAMLPEYVDPSLGNLFAQTATLSAIYVAIASAVHLSLVVFASQLRPLISDDKLRPLRRALALTLGAVAIWFAISTGRH